jgi:hypothetical protein
LHRLPRSTCNQLCLGPVPSFQFDLRAVSSHGATLRLAQPSCHREAAVSTRGFAGERPGRAGVYYVPRSTFQSRAPSTAYGRSRKLQGMS